MFAAVECLTFGIDACEWIHRLHSIIAVYARLRGDSALQPITIVVSVVAWYGSDPPPVDLLAEVGDGLLDLSVTFLHAQTDFELLLQRKVFEVHGLAWPDANARKLGSYLCLVGQCRRELQREIEVFEEISLYEILVDFRKVDSRRRRWRRLVQVSGKHLRLVAGLNLLDVVDIVSAEKLAAISRHRKLRARPEHLLDTGRRLALPVRPDNHVIAWFASRRAGADIAVVVGIAVAEHDRVVALRVHGRFRQND